MIDNPLTYILIKPNVINAKGIEELVNHIESSPLTDLSVFDSEEANKASEPRWKVEKDTRDTQTVPLGHTAPKIEGLLRDAVHNIINPFYGIEVEGSELPQILSYGIGGHYKPHIDGESVWCSPRGERIWKKSTDRDLSLVFYLNNDFEGGDFIFPEHKVRVRPEPGMMICFPSNHHYLHGVEPVTKGKRYSIVTWATVKGHLSLEEINQNLSKEYGVPVF